MKAKVRNKLFSSFLPYETVYYQRCAGVFCDLFANCIRASFCFFSLREGLACFLNFYDYNFYTQFQRFLFLLRDPFVF